MTTLYIRLAACLALVAALIAAWFDLTSHYEAKGYERAKQEDKAAAEAQTARNRDLQRQAELRYVVKREAQDRFFVTTVKEVREQAAPLADCRLPDALRVRLNEAARCAFGDSPAACGPADEVPDAR